MLGTYLGTYPCKIELSITKVPEERAPQPIRLGALDMQQPGEPTMRTRATGLCRQTIPIIIMPLSALLSSSHGIWNLQMRLTTARRGLLHLYSYLSSDTATTFDF